MLPRKNKLMNKQPKNQHQLTLWYLLNYRDITLLDIINDSRFHKFQTRLSELTIEYSILQAIVDKSTKSFTNRFGVKSTYLVYNLINIKSNRVELQRIVNEVFKI